MRWITHIAIAPLFIKLLEISLLIDLTSFEFWVILSVYAVMPDFDTLIGIKHRTYTHTLYAAVLASLPLIFDLRLFITALTAYLSHLFADMLTVSGLMLLYPFKETTYHLLSAAWRIKTGSNTELLLFAMGFGIIVAYRLGVSYAPVYAFFILIYFLRSSLFREIRK